MLVVIRLITRKNSEPRYQTVRTHQNFEVARSNLVIAKITYQQKLYDKQNMGLLYRGHMPKPLCHGRGQAIKSSISFSFLFVGTMHLVLSQQKMVLHPSQKRLSGPQTRTKNCILVQKDSNFFSLQETGYQRVLLIFLKSTHSFELN